MEASGGVFSLGGEAKLKSLFEAADLGDVEITTERHRFVLPSFDAYFEPFEQGAGSPGQAYVSLAEETRRTVREEVRHDLGDTGGPIRIEVEYRFGSGRRYDVSIRIQHLCPRWLTSGHDALKSRIS